MLREIDSGAYDFLFLLVALALAGAIYMEWAHRMIEKIMAKIFYRRRK